MNGFFSGDLTIGPSLTRLSMMNIIETCDSEIDLVIGRGQYIQPNGHAVVFHVLYDGQLNS